jgi:transketolase
MVVCSPSDPVETKMLVHLSVTHQGPMYIRLGKAGEQVFHPQEIQSYHLGDLLPIINKGSETLVLTSGSILARVMESVETKHLDYDVFTVPVIKPLNQAYLCHLAEQHAQIIIVEENQKSAGIGSAIIEILSDAFNSGALSRYPKVNRIAINDEFLEVAGSQRYLQQTAGLIL